jgi:hypothetical protein
VSSQNDHELTGRIRALFGTREQPALELVMAANATATLAIVGFFWLQVGLTAGWIAVWLPVVFGLLTACMLSRYTVWIAAILGSLGIAFIPALLLGAALDSLPSGRWIGAALGGGGGFVAGMWTYLRVTPRPRPIDPGS